MLGRDLIKTLKINIDSDVLKFMWNLTDLAHILKQYDDLFKQELGLYKCEKVNLKMDTDVKPIFCKPRPISFSFRESINKEFDD